jgi:phosphohistidine phosphatase
MTKTLYLVRHARAEARGKEWPDDRLRPLTKDGVRRMERAAGGLKALGFQVDLIFTSPLVRARDTARILSKRTPGRPKIEEVRWLEPETSPEDVANGLLRRGAARIALVGHEPEMGTLAAWLLGADQPVLFRKGAVACFEIQGLPLKPPAVLKWFAPAKLLARAGRPA